MVDGFEATETDDLTRGGSRGVVEVVVFTKYGNYNIKQIASNDPYNK